MTHLVDAVQEVLDYEMDPGFDALILTDLIILVSEKVTKIHISNLPFNLFKLRKLYNSDSEDTPRVEINFDLLF